MHIHTAYGHINQTKRQTDRQMNTHGAESWLSQTASPSTKGPKVLRKCEVRPLQHAKMLARRVRIYATLQTMCTCYIRM